MKKLLFLLMIITLSCQPKEKADVKTTVNSTLSESKLANENILLRHVVLFKFKDSATDEDIHEVESAFSALPSKIKEIKEYEWGLNNSPEGLNKGFTHCFQLTFHSEEDRDVYLPHPDHKAFGTIVGPVLEDVLVVDYWTGDKN